MVNKMGKSVLNTKPHLKKSIVRKQKPINKIREEASGVKDLKDTIAYLDVHDVDKASKLIQDLGQILSKLDLVKSAYSG
jgi:hypothetical protein